MEYQIFTFGNGEILKGVFDAIATCLNSHSGTLYIPLIRISMIIGGLWAALYAIYGDYVRAINGWIIPMTAIMQLFFVPQATVWIVDPVSRYHEKVDHVPYGLAMVAGKTSQFGKIITRQVEKVFVLPRELKYQKTGALFASNLLQQAKTFRIANEDLAENMRQFVGQCVAYDALLGKKYTIEDLRHSDDIWSLVSTNASPIRSFVWRDLRQENQSSSSRPEIITCQQGIGKFNEQWDNELNKAATIFGKKIFGKNTYIDPKPELLKYLPIAYTALTDMAKSAQEILKQNMMIYSIVDGIEQKSTSLGNAPNFAVRRAYLQQRSTYETLGAMAAETLPTMKGILEAIAYSSFLFIIPLAILPFGWTFLKNWIQVLLWLQTWAPMYAILNYIMTLAARAKSISALSVSNEAGVTIANSVGLVNVNADIAAMAGYLAMSIPFLCVAIIKGVSSFVSVPGILSNVTQGVASQAATEAVTGNYNFGNIAEGTRQISNTSMLNHSYAASYRSGSFHQANGRADVITSADGQQVLNIGNSNLPVSLNVAETKSSQLMTQASISHQRGLALSESSAKHMADTLNNSVELSDHLSSSKQNADQYNDNKSIEQIAALNKSAQSIKDFAGEHNVTTTQAAQILAAVNCSTDRNIVGKAIGQIIGANAEIRGSISAEKNEQNVYRNAQKLVQSEDFQKSLRESSQLSHNQAFAKHDDEGKRLANNLNHSWNESNNLRQEATKSFTESENYQKQATSIKNSSASINANYNQQFLEWFAEQKADNTSNGRIGNIGVAHIMAHDPEIATKYAERFLQERNILSAIPSELQTKSPDNLKSNYKEDNRHNIVDVTKDNAYNGMNAIKNLGKEQGLMSVNNNLEKKFNNQQQEAGINFANEEITDQCNNKFSKYNQPVEEDCN